MERCIIYLILTVIYGANGLRPGTFFWKPRLALDFIARNITHGEGLPVTYENIRNGYVMLITAYNFGVTMVVLTEIMTSYLTPFPHLNPVLPDFYTNAYRWGLRHFSLYPAWLAGNAREYSHTHKAWKKRFHYANAFIPKALRMLFPYISDAEWQREINDYKLFRKYAEPAFSRQFRFPYKVFRNFSSMIESKEKDQDTPTSSS